MRVRCIETGKEYNSAYQVEKQEGIAATNIYKVLKGQRHTAGGYHWEKVIDRGDKE